MYHGGEVERIFDRMISTSPTGPLAIAAFLSGRRGFGDSASSVGVDRFSESFSPEVSSRQVSHCASESGLGRFCASSRSRAEYRVRLTVNLRRAALAARFKMSCGFPPFLNRRAVLPGALGSPDKTAHDSDAARIKQKAGDRRYIGKSPALL